MPTIAIIGAGPGMGLAIARTFGTQGFKVALLSRNPGKQQGIIGTLSKECIEAEAFETNVLDVEEALRNHQSIEVFSVRSDHLCKATPSVDPLHKPAGTS